MMSCGRECDALFAQRRGKVGIVRVVTSTLDAMRRRNCRVAEQDAEVDRDDQVDENGERERRKQDEHIRCRRAPHHFRHVRDVRHVPRHDEKDRRKRGQRDVGGSGASRRTISNSVTAWTMPATGLVAPLRMLVAVRAIAPVAAKPPNSGVTTLAMPWPISSWLESWRFRPCRRPPPPRAAIRSSQALRWRTPAGSVDDARHTELGQRRQWESSRDPAERRPDRRQPVEMEDRSASVAATSATSGTRNPRTAGRAAQPER